MGHGVGDVEFLQFREADLLDELLRKALSHLRGHGP